MLKRNKRISRSTRKKSRTRKVLIGICLAVCVLSLILGASILFLGNKPDFISPLPNMLQDALTQHNTPDSETIKALLEKHHIEYTRVLTGSDEEYRVILERSGEVLLTGKKDLASQVTSLQVILTRLTMEGKQFKSLDMRFDKPVVVFQ